MLPLLMAVSAMAGYFVERGITVPAPILIPSPSASVMPSASPYAPETWKTWQDGMYDKKTGSYTGYAFSYPRDFDVNRRDYASGNLMGTALVQLRFPEDAFVTPKTNFAQAYMTVAMATGTRALSACFLVPGLQGMKPMDTILDIHGQQFRAATSTDVGAGSLYASHVYRTEYKNACYEFSLTVHTGNIMNYTPGTVTEFDSAQAFEILTKIVQSVRFTDVPRL